MMFSTSFAICYDVKAEGAKLLLGYDECERRWLDVFTEGPGGRVCQRVVPQDQSKNTVPAVQGKNIHAFSTGTPVLHHRCFTAFGDICRSIVILGMEPLPAFIFNGRDKMPDVPPCC